MSAAQNKKIVVLGAGESGVGAAVLAKKEGYDVFVSDSSTIKQHYKELLDSHSIAWEECRHSEEKIMLADEIIKSPGIPATAPIIAKAVKKGIGIISEIEFAGRFTDSKIVCITGSNGKTTTTTLIYSIFRMAGMDVGLAGNIGHSLALQVAEHPHKWYVTEISSFQLENMYAFRADIAVLLNITPDHLDRYNWQMQGYADAKMRITRNQTESDFFIYWEGDPVIKQELPKYDIRAARMPFEEKQTGECAAYTRDGIFIVERPKPFTMPLSNLSLRGRHNLYNSMAAAMACLAAGIDEETVRCGLESFPGVEHRLEYVCTINGVKYINDSKATNVDACRYALESMTGPTILIIGGRDKGNDYSPIKELVANKCVGIVYLGADNTKLHANFDCLGIPVRDTNNMTDCVDACRLMARPGDTVLLSPCCASFDLFHNMEERGEQFKALARQEKNV